jgi:hypothetical protein
MNDIPVAIISVPNAIPSSVWRSALNDVNWTDAANALASDRAHYVVAVLRSPETPLHALENAFVVTLISALLYESAAVSSAYWSSSQTLTPRESFARAGRALGMDTALTALPIDIWVRTRFTKSDSGAIGAVTTGLRPFVGRELELVPTNASTRTVAKRAYALAYQIVRQGTVIGDNDTVEIEGQKFLARWRERGSGADSVKVVVLERMG